MNGHSKDCSPVTSQTPLECGPAPLPLHALALHISPSQISWLPRPPPCYGAEPAQFLMKSLSPTPIYHPQSGPSLALNLYCFYTTISSGEFLSSLGVSIIVIIIPKLYKLFLFSIRKLSTIQDFKGVHLPFLCSLDLC